MRKNMGSWWPFFERTKPPSVPVIFVSYFDKAMSQQGKTWACVWSPSPSSGVGHASTCHPAAVPSPSWRTPCGFRSQAGSVRCLDKSNMLGGAGRGQVLTVMCNEVTRWEQNNKSFEFEVIFFISYLFLFFFCVNIFILLWSSNNIWMVTCAECK